MGLKDKRLITLKEIEGPMSPHDGFIKHEMDRTGRKEALSYIDDASWLAKYIGGEIVSLGLGEDWAIKKEVFPGIEIIFVYNKADDEFPSNLRVLYSGQSIKRYAGRT
ncbi:MAG TPA: DUF3786 domain-containing protein [Dehalococcoidia bacterium]|nr:DUF3786 domain-containing protein [Dehalococcoidia bacterium]